MRSGAKTWLDGRIVLPLVLLILTSIYLAGALRIASPYEDQGVGASFFPIVLAVVMYAALLVVLVNGVREAREGAPAERLRLGDPLKVVLLTCLYILLFRPIGYFLATTLYVLALLYVFNFGSTSHLKRIAAAIAIAIAFYLLFETAFQVRLPKLWGEIV